MVHLNPISYVLFLAALLLASLQLVVWQRRKGIQTILFALLMTLTIVWLLTYGMELSAPDTPSAVTWAKLEYISISFIGTLWTLFVLAYLDYFDWLTPTHISLLFLLPCLTLLVAWTNEYHHLLWMSYKAEVTPTLTRAIIEYGVWFYLHSIYSYLIGLVGAVLLVRRMMAALPSYRPQLLLVLITWLIPIVTDILQLTQVVSQTGVDYTCLSFVPAGLLLSWDLLYFRMFDVLPLAYDSILNVIRGGVIVTDNNDCVVLLNPTGHGLLHELGAEVAVGQPVDVALAGLPALLNVYHLDRDDHYDLVIRCPNAPVDEEALLYLDADIYSIRERQGYLAGRVLVLRDVTARVLAEEQLRANERTLRVLLNGSPDIAAMLIDTQGFLLAFNENLATFVGQPSADLHEKNLFTRLPWPLADRIGTAVSRVLTTRQPERWQDEYEGHYDDTSLYPILNKHGEVENLAIFLRDITSLKRAEETIKSYAGELEERNADLDAFSRTVAHDLKKPLQGIIGYAGLIQMDFEDMPQDMHIFVDSIVESAELMVEMIDNLLMLAQMRDTQGVIGVMNMNEIVARALRRFEDDLQDRAFTLAVQPDLPPSLGYAPWMEEVVANLVSNTIKYIGQSNPAPRLSVRGVQQGDQVVYTIEDNGLGIPPEKQDRLFEMFTRFHHAEASGTGLGLSIVKRIVEKMNGSVALDSEEGRGSAFSFTLPAPPASDEA